MIDYTNIIGTVNRLIKSKTGLPIVEQDGNQKQPKYPFCIYTVTSPYLVQTSFYRGDKVTEQVEIVISYTWASTDSIEAMSLAQKTASFLKHPATRQNLSDAGIVVVRTEAVASRDTFISIEMERRAGFDLRLRVGHTEIEMNEVIETIE